MSIISFNTTAQRRVPVKRNNLFYDRQSFGYEVQVGKEYMEMDMGQTLVLYRVDLNKTNQDQLYGETDSSSVSYLPPIEVPCVYEIGEPELKAYDKTTNLGTYQKTGKLKFGVYEATLKELNCDIKIGDYIGIQVSESHMEYFVVNNDGKNNYDNGHTMFGTVPFYRSCTANPVDASEFNG